MPFDSELHTSLLYLDRIQAADENRSRLNKALHQLTWDT